MGMLGVNGQMRLHEVLLVSMISYVMEAFVCKITSVNCFLVVGRVRTILF